MHYPLLEIVVKKVLVRKRLIDFTSMNAESFEWVA